MNELANVRITDHGAWTVSLHRPERLNAFDGGLVVDLGAALADAATDPLVHVVVLTGSGRAFSTGADLKALAEPRPASDAGQDPAGASGFDRLLDHLADFPKPLLMAVNGYAVGFGMTMLAFADVVFMSTEARLRCPFTSSEHRPRPARAISSQAALGRQQAAWTLLSSEWITAEQALAIGLAWQLCEPAELLDITHDHVQRLATRSVAALSQVKRLLNAPERAELAAAFARGASDAAPRSRAASAHNTDERVLARAHLPRHRSRCTILLLIAAISRTTSGSIMSASSGPTRRRG